MNTYNYKCLDCDSITEIKATIQEKEEGKSDKFACSKCKSKNIKQQIFVTSFVKNIFKNKDGGCGDGGCCAGGCQ